MSITFDKEGFLVNLNDWSETVAETIAKQEGIELEQAHWEIIKTLQKFYQCYEISPAMRPLSKFIKQELGEEKSKSIYLLSLFPRSPAKIAAKIAGLPKPDNCL